MGYIPLSDIPNPVQQLSVQDLFLGGGSPMGGGSAATDPPPTPQFDFHEAVAITSQYPVLQRRLGLVVDFVASVPADVIGAVAGETNIRIVPTSDPSDVPLLPWTRVRLGREGFVAAPLDPNLVSGGTLRSGNLARFKPITVDLDGAAMKLLSHAGSVVNASNGQNPEALAALRTGGLGLAQQDRGQFLHETLVRAAQNNADLVAGLDVTLFAEDLMRGFRVDIWEESAGRWSSLMRRTAELSAAPPAGVDAVPVTIALDDEGFVTTSPTEASGPVPPGTIRLAESLFTWTGWSLAVPQPGKVLDNPSASGGGPVVADPDATDSPQPALNVMTTSLKPVQGSLPALRFGQTYRSRVRTVDAAGIGPAFDQAPPDADTSTAPIQYRRFEPVAAPEVLLRVARSEGETVDRLVIRSEGPDDSGPDVSERHVAPAKSSWQMAESHGLLDRHVNGRNGPDPAKFTPYYLEREGGGFGSRTGADGVSTFTHPQAMPEPNTAEGMYYYNVPSVVINYLPDPMARGATLWPLPGTTSPAAIPHDKVSFGTVDAAGESTWPEYQPFRLALNKGSGAPSLDGRVLNVFLPRGEVAEVLLSNHLSEGDQELLGVYGWVEAKVREVLPDYEPLLRQAAEDGWLWVLTPSRTLTLVHAVRVPLSAPRIANPVVLRLAGDTFARIVGQVVFDRKSTSRVDVVGSWVDCVDDPAHEISDPDSDFDAPGEVPAFSVEADRLTGATDLLDDSLQLADQHEFGDTRHRKVTYQATAVSRFTEYFVERLAHVTGSDPSATDTIMVGKPVVQGSVVVKTSDSSSTYIEDRDFFVDTPTGTVTLELRPKLSLPGSNPVGVPVSTKVDIAYLPVPHSVTGDPSIEVSIPSSARPQPPLVEYVVPTFAWNENLPAPGSGSPVLSFRFGKSLRIYLDRPWFSSGCGEKLGVVFWLAPPPVGTVFPDAPSHVTHWALDPLYNGPSLPSGWPGHTSFPSASKVAGPFILPEFVPGSEQLAAVGVAVHEVHFDADRQKWFCDITLETGFAYSPFVRLALVRYQEQSIPGLELSQVVRADYAQVAPDRAVSLTFGDKRVEVLLVGVDGTTISGPGVAEAWLEEKDPLVTSEELGWDRTGGITSLTRSLLPGFPVPVAQWQGRVKLRDNGRRRRVVVQQYEQFQEGTGLLVSLQRRLVHSDVLEI
ncbi:MAG: hypothetical protein OEO77_10035 [Acidimicrobiia bacterium]|nr:hypothetical protein [Acidimicrobiia bacterium]